MNAEQKRKRGNMGKNRIEKRRNRAESGLNRLLLRLIASAVVFLLVFVGGRLIPERTADVFGTVRRFITADLDLDASVEAFGNAIRSGESIPAALREWCVDTFLPLYTDGMEESQLQKRLSISAVYHAHLISPQMDVLSLRRTS